MGNDSDRKRQRLIALGPESLADGLLELADRHADVADWIERMTASPKENVERFKAKLAALKRRTRFIGWSESAAYARELSDLLENLRAGVEDPKLGTELVAAFFQADRAIFEQCDDSNGSIGQVFRHDATNLFVHYAARCADEAWLCRLVQKVSAKDDYGVRDTLVKSASEFLPESNLRSLADHFWQRAEQEGDDYPRRHWIFLVESLARQLKDAPLFEKARRNAWPELSTAACVDIARVYFEAGQAGTALAWLERIPVTEAFQADERDGLLMKVHQGLGNHAAATDAAWRMFRRGHSEETLNALLALIGEERRDQVISGESSRILEADHLSYADAHFLLRAGRVADAEHYLLARANQFNGDAYVYLLPLAEAMEQAGRWLVASLMYRALLGSILRRAQSKYYHHGARYLKKMEAIAPNVANWQTFIPHDVYFQELKQTHARKTSFWARYSEPQ